MCWNFYDFGSLVGSKASCSSNWAVNYWSCVFLFYFYYHYFLRFFPLLLQDKKKDEETHDGDDAAKEKKEKKKKVRHSAQGRRSFRIPAPRSRPGRYDCEHASRTATPH